MGGVARATLAAAVSEAGGYGCLGMVREPPAMIVEEIRRTRELTDRTFADAIARERVAEEGGRPIYLWSTDSPLRSMTGELDRLAQFAGQVSGQIVDVPAAGDRVASIVREAEAALGRLSRGVAA